MKLWHDDVRPPPEGWVWARTNDLAKEALLTGKVVEISMDHDLGYHDVELPEDPDELAEVLFSHQQQARDSETGLDLCHWMVEQDIFPAVITIHSWNPDGAKHMAARLARSAPQGTTLTVAPFKP